MCKHIADERGSAMRFSTSCFFHESVSPQAPECPIRVISNVFKNLQRYLMLKMHHWCHWPLENGKIFHRKSFNYFVWTTLDSRINILIDISFKFTLRCKQSDIVPIVCHQCHCHQWQIYRQCCWYLWQFATSVVDTSDKFAAVSTTTAVPVMKFTAGVVDTGGAPYICEYLHKC